MPYIKPEDRNKFIFENLEEESNLPEMIGELCNNSGDLNYVFTLISQSYLKQKGLKYQHINDIVGALEGAKLEMYRRIASDYEDKKINENGDVMPCFTSSKQVSSVPKEQLEAEYQNADEKPCYPSYEYE